jgi:hypothetical protein
MTRQKIDERFLQKFDEGIQKARIGALKGALRRAAQALQDVHVHAGNIGINDEAAVALANADRRSGKPGSRRSPRRKWRLPAAGFGRDRSCALVENGVAPARPSGPDPAAMGR